MVEKIKITFLGTADAFPSKERNHTAILLAYAGENILIDCGEGTQRQFRKSGVNPGKVTKILITHWHGDHVLGIPGLLQTLAFSDYKKTLEIYGPKGTKKFIKEMLKVFVFVNEIKLKIIEIEKPGIFFEDKKFYLEAEKMVHGTATLAYNFILKGKLRIDKEKMQKAKISSSPLLKKLKDKKDVVIDGKKYKWKDFTYVQDGKKVSFVLDTRINDKIVKFVKDADLLVIESSFDSSLEERAKLHEHLTSKQAGEIAKKAKVKNVYLTHVSQRYEKHLDKILGETKKIFKDAHVAEDLKSVEI